MDNDLILNKHIGLNMYAIATWFRVSKKYGMLERCKLHTNSDYHVTVSHVPLYFMLK